MMKKLTALMMVLMLVLSAGALAETNITQQDAEAAVLAKIPQAQIGFTLLDRDDGRYEWEVYYMNGALLGVCEVDAQTGEILRTKEYDDTPQGALSADAAIALLAQTKGELTVVELDLDREGRQLRYEGEAELGGRRYEFEMTVEGRIVEWERD